MIYVKDKNNEKSADLKVNEPEQNNQEQKNETPGVTVIKRMKKKDLVNLNIYLIYLFYLNF